MPDRAPGGCDRSPRADAAEGATGATGNACASQDIAALENPKAAMVASAIMAFPVSVRIM